MRRALPGPWTVDRPGYWFDGLEDEDSTAVYWYGERTFRASSFMVEAREGEPPTAANLIGAADTESEFVELVRDHLRGRAEIERVFSRERTLDTYEKLLGRCCRPRFRPGV